MTVEDLLKCLQGCAKESNVKLDVDGVAHQIKYPLFIDIENGKEVVTIRANK